MVFNESVLNLLISIGKKEGLKEVRVEKLGEWEKGENYLGEVTPANIIGENGQLDVIVKNAITNDSLRKSVKIEMIYHKEIFIYTQVVKVFRQFESSKNISDSISYIPKCYASSMDYNKEILVLENLKSKGFQMAERRKPLNQDHIQLVLETLGKWHALSFAFRQQNPEEYNRLYQTAENNPLPEIHVQFGCNDILVKEWTSIRNTFNPITEAKYINFLNECIRNIDHFADGLHDIDEKYSVIIHGDGWTNNFLFKYQNLKPIELYFVDFQMSRIASPVMDLNYFTYSSTGANAFNDLNHLLRLYHDSLGEHLNKLGTNVDDVYPFSILEKEWRKWCRWGFMTAFFTVKISLSEQSEAANFKDVKNDEELKQSLHYDVANLEEYNTRCRDIVKHFVDYNLMDMSIFT